MGNVIVLMRGRSPRLGSKQCRASVSVGPKINGGCHCDPYEAYKQLTDAGGRREGGVPVG